ncbi:MAG: TMEM165/GDT1 family protein [Pseudanabaena sp. ELA607]
MPPSPLPNAISKPLVVEPELVSETPSVKIPDHAAVPATNRANFWQVAVTTFLTVFLAEIGDKTQLTTLMITAESKQPAVVFAGAGVALVLTSLLGAMAGKWLGEKVSPKVLNLLAAASFLGLSISLVWDAVS